MSTSATRYLSMAVLALATTLAACGPSKEGGELQWARAALERNPALEVVAVDADAGTFTVRSKTTGAVRTVALDELAAGPVADLAATPVTAGATAPASAADGASLPPGPEAASRAREGEADAQAGEAASSEGAEAAGAARGDGDAPGYTVERANGRLKITGPGISIATTDAGAAGATGRTPPPVAHDDDPIVCEGRRFLQLDNRTLAVNGDAVIARGGCELHITNSRITATGVALQARGAKVHVTNSTLEGDTASIEASEGADVYLQDARLKGITRRLGGATLHDLGGNAWR